MAVYTEETARACVRVRDGKRVFFLDEKDRLTPAARSWLQREAIPILPAKQAQITQYQTLFGAVLTEKPEHMTHLYPTVLVMKNHPRIEFRGKIDALEAELLLCAQLAHSLQRTEYVSKLQEVLDYVRRMIRCDVLQEPFAQQTLCGFTDAQLREHSHHPQKYYDQPHFMPAPTDGRLLLALNRLRTMVRETELAACRAFLDRDGAVQREDLLRALNRLSSLVWIWMIQLKKENGCGSE